MYSLLCNFINATSTNFPKNTNVVSLADNVFDIFTEVNYLDLSSRKTLNKSTKHFVIDDFDSNSIKLDHKDISKSICVEYKQKIVAKKGSCFIVENEKILLEEDTEVLFSSGILKNKDNMSSYTICHIFSKNKEFKLCKKNRSIHLRENYLIKNNLNSDGNMQIIKNNDCFMVPKQFYNPKRSLFLFTNLEIPYTEVKTAKEPGNYRKIDYYLIDLQNRSKEQELKESKGMFLFLNNEIIEGLSSIDHNLSNILDKTTCVQFLTADDSSEFIFVNDFKCIVNEKESLKKSDTNLTNKHKISLNLPIPDESIKTTKDVDHKRNTKLIIILSVMIPICCLLLIFLIRIINRKFNKKRNTQL